MISHMISPHCVRLHHMHIVNPQTSPAHSSGLCSVQGPAMPTDVYKTRRSMKGHSEKSLIWMR